MDYGDWRLGTPQLDPQVQAIAKALRRPNAVPPPENSTYWVRTWPGAEDVEIFDIDKNPWAQPVNGWTVCDKDKRKCQIMILKNVDRACVEQHERRHAAGYDHPDYPEPPIGVACQR